MATQTTKKWDREEIGVGWTRESAKGEKYLSGVFKVDGKDVPWVAYKNRFKKAGNQPDLRFYKSQPKGGSAAAPTAPAPAAPAESDDIAF